MDGGSLFWTYVQRHDGSWSKAAVSEQSTFVSALSSVKVRFCATKLDAMMVHGWGFKASDSDDDQGTPFAQNLWSSTEFVCRGASLLIDVQGKYCCCEGM